MAMWHIVGVGAIGCLWAHKLASAGETVHLVFKNIDQLNAYKQRQNISLTDLQGNKRYISFKATTLDKLNQKIDKVLVTTKSWQTHTTVKHLLQHLRPSSTVVLLQNGYGQLIQSQALLAKYAYYVATTTDGVYKTSAYDAVIAGEGETQIGPFNTLARNKNVLNDATYNANIDQALWQKLCVNAVINPLTAIYNICNGEILNHEACQHIINPLCAEIATLSAAENYPISAKSIMEIVHNVATLTANNTSSMRQDILLQRKTEINEINGYLQFISHKHGLQTPVNHNLLKTVKKKQQLRQ